MNPSKEPLCLGLLGGLGPGATVHYYRALVDAHAALQRSPRLLIIQADMQRALRFVRMGATAEMAKYFAELIQHLADGGAQVAAIPAITPHICIDDLLPISPLPLVNILDEVVEEIRARGLKRLALFGTRYVIESKLFGRLPDVDIITPKPDELEFIHETYMRLGNDGVAGSDDHRQLSTLAKQICDRDRVDAIVLAGTELALVFNEHNTDFPHVDCARVHLDAIMRRLNP